MPPGELDRITTILESISSRVNQLSGKVDKVQQEVFDIRVKLARLDTYSPEECARHRAKSSYDEKRESDVETRLRRVETDSTKASVKWVILSAIGGVLLTLLAKVVTGGV